MDDIKVAVKYPLGHIYHEHMKRSDGYCPNCGGKTVWDNLGAGDYYYGSPSYCTTCDFIWHLCLEHKMDPKDAADSQIMKAIKEQL